MRRATTVVGWYGTDFSNTKRLFRTSRKQSVWTSKMLSTGITAPVVTATQECKPLNRIFRSIHSSINLSNFFAPFSRFNFFIGLKIPYTTSTEQSSLIRLIRSSTQTEVLYSERWTNLRVRSRTIPLKSSMANRTTWKRLIIGLTVLQSSVNSRTRFRIILLSWKSTIRTSMHFTTEASLTKDLVSTSRRSQISRRLSRSTKITQTPTSTEGAAMTALGSLTSRLVTTVLHLS